MLDLLYHTVIIPRMKFLTQLFYIVGTALFISHALSACLGLKEKMGGNLVYAVVYFSVILLLVALGWWMVRRKSGAAEAGSKGVEKAADFERTYTALSFPVLLMYEEDAPELLNSPQDAAKFDYIEGCTLYSESGVFTVKRYRGGENPAAQLVAKGLLDIVELKKHIGDCLEADDDLMTQYYDKEILEYLLAPCADFAEILCWGALTYGIPEVSYASLPEFVEEDFGDEELPELEYISRPGYSGPLSIEHIRRCASQVKFTTYPDFLPTAESAVVS